jgi:transcriptional regulator with XRE-family HTH domain
MKFGEKLRELREKRDISLRELANKVSRSAAFLSDVELGRRMPSDEVIVKLAEVLGVPLEELQSLNTRAQVQELRSLMESNPAYNIALRKVMQKKISPERLARLADETGESKKPT